jgi:hypothetical protein
LRVCATGWIEDAKIDDQIKVASAMVSLSLHHSWRRITIGLTLVARRAGR